MEVNRCNLEWASKGNPWTSLIKSVNLTTTMISTLVCAQVSKDLTLMCANLLDSTKKTTVRKSKRKSVRLRKWMRLSEYCKERWDRWKSEIQREALSRYRVTQTSLIRKVTMNKERTMRPMSFPSPNADRRKTLAIERTEICIRPLGKKTKSPKEADLACHNNNSHSNEKAVKWASINRLRTKIRIIKERCSHRMRRVETLTRVAKSSKL